MTCFKDEHRRSFISSRSNWICSSRLTKSIERLSMLFNSSSKKISKSITELRRLITYSRNELRGPIDRLRWLIAYSKNKLRGPIEEVKIYCMQANRK
jgi:hypothetical protein